MAKNVIHGFRQFLNVYFTEMLQKEIDIDHHQMGVVVVGGEGHRCSLDITYAYKCFEYGCYFCPKFPDLLARYSRGAVRAG